MTKKTTTKLVKIDEKLIDDNSEHWNSKCTLTRMRNALGRANDIPDDVRLQADLALQLSCIKAPSGLWPSFYLGREVDAWRAGKAAEILEPLVGKGKVSGVDAYNAKLAVAYWRTRPINMAGELVHDIRMLELASSGLLTALRLVCVEAYHLSGCGVCATGADVYADGDRRLMAWANRAVRGTTTLLRPETAFLHYGARFAGEMLRGAVDDYLAEAPQDGLDICPC